MPEIHSVDPKASVTPKAQDLTGLQNAVLAAIERDPTLGRIALADSAAVKRSAVNHAIDALVKKGYLSPKRVWRVLKHPLAVV